MGFFGFPLDRAEWPLFGFVCMLIFQLLSSQADRALACLCPFQPLAIGLHCAYVSRTVVTTCVFAKALAAVGLAGILVPIPISIAPAC